MVTHCTHIILQNKGNVLWTQIKYTYSNESVKIIDYTARYAWEEHYAYEPQQCSHTMRRALLGVSLYVSVLFKTYSIDFLIREEAVYYFDI